MDLIQRILSTKTARIVGITAFLLISGVNYVSADCYNGFYTRNPELQQKCIKREECRGNCEKEHGLNRAKIGIRPELKDYSSGSAWGGAIGTWNEKDNKIRKTYNDCNSKCN
jgi:hypothetical protein